jgi:hypothetical protein
MAGKSEEFALKNYYSLLELLEKLGKEGVAELLSKGKPERVTRGDMIYFLKSDVESILGKSVGEENSQDSSGEIIIEEPEDAAKDLLSQIVVKQSLLKRFESDKEEEVYKDRVLDFSEEVLYGRTKGHPQDQAAFKESGVISSLHGKLSWDEDSNLLYENLGANKSKIRGCKDQNYTVLEKDEIGVLIAREAVEDSLRSGRPLTASIKLGYQKKPHFIIRVSISRKHKASKKK